MLSVAKISSAAAGASYYQKDNYYDNGDKNGQGKRRGKASRELGLENKTVKIDDFERYLEGHMPGNQSIFRMMGVRNNIL